MGKFYIINCSYPQCSVDPKLYENKPQRVTTATHCYPFPVIYHTNTWLYANIAGPEREVVPGPDCLNDSLHESGGEGGGGECKQ